MHVDWVPRPSCPALLAWKNELQVVGTLRGSRGGTWSNYDQRSPAGENCRPRVVTRHTFRADFCLVFSRGQRGSVRIREDMAMTVVDETGLAPAAGCGRGRPTFFNVSARPMKPHLLMAIAFSAGVALGAPPLASAAVVFDSVVLVADSNVSVADANNSKNDSANKSHTYVSLHNVKNGVDQIGDSAAKVDSVVAVAMADSETEAVFTNASEGSYFLDQSVATSIDPNKKNPAVDDSASGDTSGEFIYTFDLTKKDYNITLTGDPFSGYQTDFCDITTHDCTELPTGSFSETFDNLTPGKYSLETSDTGFAGSPGATANGNFTFDITAVPEPATWAMMLFGVGMIGAGLRMARRKSDFALTAA